MDRWYASILWSTRSQWTRYWGRSWFATTDSLASYTAVYVTWPVPFRSVRPHTRTHTCVTPWLPTSYLYTSHFNYVISKANVCIFCNFHFTALGSSLNITITFFRILIVGDLVHIYDAAFSHLLPINRSSFVRQLSAHSCNLTRISALLLSWN